MRRHCNLEYVRLANHVVLDVFNPRVGLVESFIQLPEPCCDCIVYHSGISHGDSFLMQVTDSS